MNKNAFCYLAYIYVAPSCKAIP